MKWTLKRWAALLLSLAMMLSLAGVAEGADVNGEILSINESAPGDADAVQAEELPEELGGIGLPVPDAEAQEAEADIPAEGEADGGAVSNALSSPETPTFGAVSNALPTKVKIGIGEKYKIDTTGLGSGLTFKSSKKAVATVTKKGTVKGKGTGTTKITVKNASGDKFTFKVTVRNAPGKVTLNKKKKTLSVGDTFQLKATLPSKTASFKRTWTSNNKSVATVDSTGKVTAVGPGTAKITVKTFNGKKATCKVTVKAPTLSADKTSLRIFAGETATVKVTCTSDGSVLSEIDDEDVATCEWQEDWDGNTIELYVYGEDAGNATITLTDEVTGKTVKIKVEVINPFEVDTSYIEMDAGDTYKLKVIYRGEKDIIHCECDDESVAECEWDEDWYDDIVTYLYISAVDDGVATIYIYDDDGYGLEVVVDVGDVTYD